MTVEGREYPRYLIWHPLDHISFATTRLPGGSVGAGVRFKIVEVLGRDPSLLVRTRDHVDLLDDSGLRLSARLAGVEVFALHHRFTREADGTQYDSTMLFGVAGRLGRVINPVLNRRFFNERHARAWLKHNVEEVGMLEHLLPRLCAEDASRTKTSRQRAPQGAISSSPAPDCETGLVAAYGDEFAAVGASLLAISLRRSGRLSALLHDH